MQPYVLRQPLTPQDESWDFQVPRRLLDAPRPGSGKMITVSADAMKFQLTQFPSNRILHADERSKFILLSLDARFRFPELPPSTTVDYLVRMLRKGLRINGVQYRFYHHSNSQLRGRSCFLREAETDEELDNRIYPMGSFGNIMNVAKRAKRIGLLFSSAQIDFNLDPSKIQDIPDIKVDDEVFSDGCGLMSPSLAVHVSRAKRIIFRGSRYTPTIFQIRYRGYKGVLMLHPQLKDTPYLAQFRKSMKKFNTEMDNSFSVVGHSRPYTFARLNNDIIVLLSSLGVSNENLLVKQQEYFDWVASAADDPMKAVDFLSSLDQIPLAERALLDGIDHPDVRMKIQSLQNAEVSKAKDDRTGRFKSRMIIHKSRRLYGVCDPYQVLKEGEVHIRVTTARKGPSTPIHGDVIIVRNPCLHPGDCLKLRAVSHPQLNHLVDCLVFASVAKPGHKAAPSMSSGGDLDGDEFFVCWDSDIIPSKISRPYDYPPNKEFNKPKVTREDLARHWASYNSSGVAKVSALHAKWVRASPLGAMSRECQELNALHSQSVDGAPIRIPEKLANPPEQKEPYILDLLESAAVTFAERFAARGTTRMSLLHAQDAQEVSDEDENAKGLIRQLFLSDQHSMTEYELFDLAFRFAQKRKIDIRPLLSQIDFSAMSFSEKHAMSSALYIDGVDYPEIWNSFIRSDILTPRDLYHRSLNKPFSIQRLYSSRISGLGTFFEYLKLATQDYTRKVLVMRTDDRFAVGIFMRGTIPWDAEEDPSVADNVVVVSFMSQTASHQPAMCPCPKGFKLHCSDLRFQLYNRNIGNTFVFINRPPVGLSGVGGKIWTSIALQNFRGTVQRQLGRVNKTPVVDIELHVVSNRDREAHQLFDMWFDHVPTEEVMSRFQRIPVPYRLNDIKDLDWEDEINEPIRWMKAVFLPHIRDSRLPSHKQRHTVVTIALVLHDKTLPEINQLLSICIKYHVEEEMFVIFTYAINLPTFPEEMVDLWLERHPSLVFALLRSFPPNEDGDLPDQILPLTHTIVRSLIRSANDTKIAALVGLEKVAKSIGELETRQYIDLLMLTALSVRAKQLAQEVLLVLNDARAAHPPAEESTEDALAREYGRKHALGVVFDRAEEAADECPCDEDGRPLRKKDRAPIQAKLLFPPDGAYDEKAQVIAHIRIDAPTTIRLHSHVRIQAASKPENKWVNPIVMDGLVVVASKGELRVHLMHPAPPEMEEMDWNIYDAGSIATANAMIDGIQRLLGEREHCCTFYPLIVDQEDTSALQHLPSPSEEGFENPEGLNESQVVATKSWRRPLSLIWGPPGTGKTTVIIQVLRDILRTYGETPPKILMTASTHNAVDNVLERFVALNSEFNFLPEDQILRVATDQSKVNPALQGYTINARVGGDLNENNKLVKQALERVNRAVIVFTTCAGAGLGVLRKIDFDLALIDEASQITEPCGLIPLVKGIKRAVIVGDHVQLRPTVRNMGKVLQYDVSLLERMYTQNLESPWMARTMLDVQYRSPRDLNNFPSEEFYEGRLRTHDGNANVSSRLQDVRFPWPTLDGSIIPAVFIQCSAEEDMGGQSKSNEGQVEVVRRILPLLQGELSVTILSPYTKQIKLLRGAVNVPCSTIDSFQGRESDVIIFSTVRCNVEADVGFLDDPRRLNVMWTRARLALIIIGDRRTLEANPLWKRAIGACREVAVDVS